MYSTSGNRLFLPSKHRTRWAWLLMMEGGRRENAFLVPYKSIVYALYTSWRWLNSSILPTNSIFIYLDYKFPSKIRLKILFADNYQENCNASVNYVWVGLLLHLSAQPPSFLLWVCFMPVSSFICGANSSHLLLCGAAVPTLWQQQWLERRGVEISSWERNSSLCGVTAAATETVEMAEVQNQHSFNKKNCRFLISFKR